MTNESSHVVLGGNGVVGRETVRALLQLGETVASVGRRPAEAAGAESVTADLLVAADVSRALRGSAVAYLTAGLPYSARVWAQQWPVIVRNVIDAALENNTHLVYFDNVYAYGPVDGPMTEATPLGANSKKGRTRVAALHALEEAAGRGLTITIGRSADFYGPGATTSVFNGFALDSITKGKDGTWLFDADQPHSLTYTPDIGRALAILGTAPTARGRSWHVPTASALTGRQYMELAAGPDSRTRVMGLITMRIGSLFNSSARESLELAYQSTRPYIFDSSRFETTFGVSATPIEVGIAETLAAVSA